MLKLDGIAPSIESCRITNRSRKECIRTENVVTVNFDAVLQRLLLGAEQTVDNI